MQKVHATDQNINLRQLEKQPKGIREAHNVKTKWGTRCSEQEPDGQIQKTNRCKGNVTRTG